MSLTIHYITADWSLHSKCLETRSVPHNHTADTLGENLKSSLAYCGLDEQKLVCITTDNGANTVAAIKNLGWPWLNCFGHNLHLAMVLTETKIGQCVPLDSVKVWSTHST